MAGVMPLGSCHWVLRCDSCGTWLFKGMDSDAGMLKWYGSRTNGWARRVLRIRYCARGKYWRYNERPYGNPRAKQRAVRVHWAIVMREIEMAGECRNSIQVVTSWKRLCGSNVASRLAYFQKRQIKTWPHHLRVAPLPPTICRCDMFVAWLWSLANPRRDAWRATLDVELWHCPYRPQRPHSVIGDSSG